MVLRAWAMARARQDRATVRSKENFSFLWKLWKPWQGLTTLIMACLRRAGEPGPDFPVRVTAAVTGPSSRRATVTVGRGIAAAPGPGRP
jgi:hypothetical protein